MSTFFQSVYTFFEKRKLILFSIFICLLVFFCYTSSKLKFEENIIRMLPGNENHSQLTSILESSKFSDQVIIIISDKDTSVESNPDKLIELATSFVDSLNSQFGDYIATINYQASDSTQAIVMSVIEQHLPVFLDETDYITLDSITSPEGIRIKVENNYRTLISPAGLALKQYVAADPIGINFLALKKLEAFKGDQEIELYNQHYITGNGHHLLIFLHPKNSSGKTEINSQFFLGIDNLISSIKSSDNNVDVHYFGAPVVAAGNSKQIRKDTKLTLTITIVLLILIFILFFRKLSSPILVLVPVVFGGLFALTIIYYLRGSISVISLGAGSLVLGIAVNYSLHFLTHLKYHPDIKGTIKELAFPMTAGSLTTIGGFLCLQFIDAPVLRDLGLFAALSLAGASIATLVFLPHFLKEKPFGEVTENPDKKTIFNSIVQFITGNKKLALLFLLATPLFFYHAKNVKFETDMYKINYMSDELKESETFVNKFSDYYRKSIYTITTGHSLEEALERNEKLLAAVEKLKTEGKIVSYTNISTLLPSHEEQIKRIKRWEDYWNKSKTETIHKTFVEAGSQFKFKESAFNSIASLSELKYEPISRENISSLQNLLLNSFIEENGNETRVIGIVKTYPEYSVEVNKALSNVSPQIFTFDRQGITDKLVNAVSSDFNFITLWTTLLVFCALLLIYGRIELAIISFLPMVLSWIWILGMMSMLDIKFNIINIVLSTLIFALGDDFCIFTTDGLQQKYARNVSTLKSTSISITLSAITTIIGMGVLIFANHPALNSIALVSIIGIFSVWMMSQVFQPVLFNFFIIRPTKRKHQPFTLFNLLKSIFAFSYFIFGSLLISSIGFIFFKIIPGKSHRKRYIYHFILSNFAWSMIHIMGNVKKTIINDLKEDFSKPSVIIANHSSFLDILLTIMLHPKLILLTNKWVWDSPIFGLAVRLAEYYPVAEGAENTTEKLAEKIAQGFSIVIFPEGTRSVDGKIGRFHKGAFFVAENLKIDILPLLIHGANYTMTKGFFFLNNGTATLKFLPRIKPDDTTFGTTYSERAKLIGKYFRNQHKQLSEQLETPEYFRSQLFTNYIYKGPVLEWYMRIKVKLEKNYELFHQLVPKKGTVVDIGCGYGFLPYMLSLTSKERIITGIDYDEEKIAIANNGYLKNDRINFEYGDALKYNYTETDTFILNDVLHYLETDSQKLLLKKCISHLSASGSIILRDGVSELKERHKGTKLTELFSTKILGFNKTASHGLNFISSEMIYAVAKETNMNITVIDNTKYTSNVIFVLKKSN